MLNIIYLITIKRIIHFECNMLAWIIKKCWLKLKNRIQSLGYCICIRTNCHFLIVWLSIWSRELKINKIIEKVSVSQAIIALFDEYSLYKINTKSILQRVWKGLCVYYLFVHSMTQFTIQYNSTKEQKKTTTSIYTHTHTKLVKSYSVWTKRS